MSPCPDCHAEDDEHERWCPVAKAKARRREYRETVEATLPPIMGRLGPDLVVRPRVKRGEKR